MSLEDAYAKMSRNYHTSQDEVARLTIRNDELQAENERLARELNRVTQGDVSNIITTLGDALTCIGQLRADIARRESWEVDARRYQRLRILGCAPMGHSVLERGLVIRFQTLDEFIDRDIEMYASRGESQPQPLPGVQCEHGQAMSDYCQPCGRIHSA